MSKFIDADLSTQVQADYLEYSIATLSRAVPDVFDGLVPSRRRLLQTMLEQGLLPEKPFVKAARTTGMTSAWYHPHGSAYGSLISMATPWNNILPYVDAHGNIGSTVDPPAAERYLEARLSTAAIDLLLQDREIWETRPNYDGSRNEAIRFNTTVPTFLLNTYSGIAVGYSSKTASHNLRDIVKCIEALLSNKPYQLLPDFKTGCDIINDQGLAQYIESGVGSILCRAKCEITEVKVNKGQPRARLLFRNLPPETNPERIGLQIKDALDKGRIHGIAEVSDFSDREGDCVGVTLRPGVDAGRILEDLYGCTDFQLAYNARTLGVIDSKPQQLSPVEVCQRWLKWRLAVLERKFRHELDIKEQRLEIVDGFIKAIAKIDAIIKLIRSCNSRSEAQAKLVDRPYKFTPDQARAILDLRLHQLNGLDANAFVEEKTALQDTIKELDLLIKSERAREGHMLKEIKALAVRHGEKRRCQLIDAIEVPKTKSEKSARPSTSRPRFMKFDSKRGVAEQVKGPRGALVLEKADKVITLTEDGILRKIPSNYKGPLGNSHCKLFLAKKESEVTSRKYLVVFELEGTIRAMALNGPDLSRTTSKGKAAVPTGSRILHCSESSWKVPFVSQRKKPVTLDLAVKAGKPGSKGIRICSVTDIAL